MPTVKDFHDGTRPALHDFLCSVNNAGGVEELLKYIQAQEEIEISNALSKGDTDYEKGAADGLKRLRSSLTNKVMSDTGTDTGE